MAYCCRVSNAIVSDITNFCFWSCQSHIRKFCKTENEISNVVIYKIYRNKVSVEVEILNTDSRSIAGAMEAWVAKLGVLTERKR